MIRDSYGTPEFLVTKAIQSPNAFGLVDAWESAVLNQVEFAKIREYWLFAEMDSDTDADADAIERTNVRAMWDRRNCPARGFASYVFAQ